MFPNKLNRSEALVPSMLLFGLCLTAGTASSNDSRLLDDDIGVDTSFEFRLEVSLPSFVFDSTERPNTRLRLLLALGELGELPASF